MPRACSAAPSAAHDQRSSTVTINVPIIQDKLAVRATVYDDRRGGYIDNVYSDFTRSNADTGNYYLGSSLMRRASAPTACLAAHRRRLLHGRQLGREQDQQRHDRGQELQPDHLHRRPDRGAVRHRRELERPDHREPPAARRRGPVAGISGRLGLPAAAAAPDHLVHAQLRQGQVQQHRLDGPRPGRAAQPDLHRQLSRPAHQQPGRLHQLFADRLRHLLYLFGRRDRPRQGRGDLLLAGDLLARQGQEHASDQRIPREYADRQAHPR